MSIYADSELLRQQRALLFQVEKAIRVANREIIHAHLPNIGGEAIYALAVTVARSRAIYVEAAFKLTTGLPTRQIRR